MQVLKLLEQAITAMAKMLAGLLGSVMARAEPLKPRRDGGREGGSHAEPEEQGQYASKNEEDRNTTLHQPRPRSALDCIQYSQVVYLVARKWLLELHMSPRTVDIGTIARPAVEWHSTVYSHSASIRF